MYVRAHHPFALVVGLLIGAACASGPSGSTHGQEDDHAGDRGQATAREHEHQPDSGHDHDHEATPPLAFKLGEGWFEPWLHRHSSHSGTPLVHAFLTEPAFLGREIFLSYTDQGAESALEAEIEWALTRRLGLVAEGAYVDSSVSGGFGDTFVALRALLIEQDRFLFSFSGEARLPTGSARKGTGAGEWGWAAIAHGWLDLGGWFSLQGTFGYEAVPAVDESVLLWSAALAKSFPVAPLFQGRRDPHGFVPALSLLAEVAGEDDEGLWLLGVTYSIAGDFDVRAAYNRSFRGEDGWTIGVIWHF